MLDQQETERVPSIHASSLSDLIIDINKSIQRNHAIYQCEITTNDYPKTRVIYTLQWLSRLPNEQGIILCKFFEKVEPMRITLPLRIWTML